MNGCLVKKFSEFPDNTHCNYLKCALWLDFTNVYKNSEIYAPEL